MSNPGKKTDGAVPGAPGLDAEVQKLASEISTYLAQRDGAADTFEGLVTWWLFRQRLADAEYKVRQAVQYLCEQGVIHTRTLVDGSKLYVADDTRRAGTGAAAPPDE